MNLALLCPGQGGQYSGMFDIIRGNTEAEAIIEHVDDLLLETPDELFAETGKAFLNRNAQPLVCAAILARWEVLRHQLPAPKIVLGYSVGELAAHVIAGTLNVENGLALAVRRAELMDAASPPNAGMIAVFGLDKDSVNTFCNDYSVEIAIQNSLNHFVVGGVLNDLYLFEQAAKSFGASTARIKVSVPAHTRWLKSAADTFYKDLAHAGLDSPVIPILAGIDGSLVRNATEAVETLAAQIAQTVQWHQCMNQAIERGATVMLDLGPSNVLVRLARKEYPDCRVLSVDEFKSLDGLLVWIERMFYC